MNKESVTLYYRAGSSDKVYHAAVDERPGGYAVNFAYGRRGSTMQAGTKTHAPVSFDEAQKIYKKLVKEKTAKGYTPGTNGTPYSGTEDAERSTGILPQLLNPVDDVQLERLLADSTHWMQEKKDGRRVLIQVGEKFVGINRKGLTIGLPESIIQCARKIGMPCVLDGEAIGDTFYAFDLLSRNGMDYRACSYRARYEALVLLIGGGLGSIKVVETHTLANEKRAAFTRLKLANAEGVVFKNPTASYTPGRPASGGSQLKFKFVATASVIVSKINVGKRSVAIELHDGNKRVSVGNVTMPPNVTMPSKCAVIEARYLYAMRGGSLYQPVFIAVRDDVDASACTITQLKYRSEADCDFDE